MIRAVLFDMDGTLIHSEQLGILAVQECFAKWGVPLDSRGAGQVMGKTWTKALELVFREYPLPSHLDENQAKQEIVQHYQQLLRQKLIPVPGAIEAVESLSKVYPLALVSGSKRMDILWSLERLGILSCFQVLLGEEDYKSSKPDPECYLKALELLQISGNEGLVFEDSDAGISSAHAAKLWVTTITSTRPNQSRSPLAHEHITDLLKVNPKWVSELFDRRIR